MKTFYKTKRLVLLGLCMLSGYSFSQTVSGYGFSALSGTFTPLTGATATSLGNTDDDVMSTAFPIGFTFNYGNVNFTQVQASSNGTLLFGTGKTQSATNDLATGTATQRPGLAPLWDDLQVTEGVKYLVQGSAPNRTLTVQWLNMEWNYQSTTPVISFQVILHETTNVIEYIYRQESTAYSAGTTGGASIGIMGVTSSDFISLQNTSASPTISSATPTNSLTSKPATGQMYRFTPPTCNQPTAVVSTGTTAFTASLDWNAGGPETTWTIEYGPTGFTSGTGTFVTVTGGTSAGTISGLMPNTAYQAYITSICSPTDSSVNSIPVSFTTLPTCPQPTATALISATTTSANLDWTAGGTETAWTIEYGPTGFTSGTGTFVTVTGTSAGTISGLTPNTFYQAYITAVCSPTDSSANSTVISFNTFGVPQYMEADNICGPAFNDISTTGQLYTLGDDEETGYTIPFPFYFQGTAVTTMTIGNNGAAFFGSLTQQVGFGNTAITNTSVTGLYPFWDDLGTTGTGVFTQVIGTAPNRQVIIQWNKTHLSVGGTTELVFQVILDEATSEIYYNYDNTMLGNATYDNGAAATVGIAGPNQDIQLSFNNSAYLTNNTCAHFYYTDCPKPSNLTFSNITSDEFSADWNAGISNETEWTVEYGVQGFTPGTGTILTGISTSDTQITGLEQLTTYDVYVYAACANGDSSVALMGSVQTLPLCANPFAVAATAHEDSIFGTWMWTQTDAALTGFNLQYVPNGSPLNAPNAVIVDADGMNFADTIADVNLMAGMTYKLYVQAECGTFVSNFIGPVSITMPLTNDTVCYAETLMVDGTVYTFTNAGATVVTAANNLEQSIAPPNTGLQTTTGWGNTTINFSTWFKFTAPASGNVRISGTDAGFNGQMAVYKVGDCGVFSSFQLIAANDNEIGGTSLAPNFTVCGLIPGTTYYLMHDSYSTTATGTYSVKITPINLEAGSVTSLLEICTGDSVNLYEGISGNDLGGVWTPVISSIDLVQDSIFASEGMAYQIFKFEYRMTDGCAYDSILASVKIFPPSQAGTDGSVLVCRNEPFNLVEGLDGTMDLNGTWYDPNGVVVPDGAEIADNLPGQYNYQYVVGNGVCPNDTSKAVVNVTGCNYLGLDEAAFEGFSLYPNPTDGYVYITNSGSTEVFSYEVLDLNGRKVMTKENAINGTAVTEIDLNTMETGVYMIHVFNGSAEKTFRVVVK